MENKKENGLLGVLTGEGAKSEDKIVKYATYAVSAVTVAALGYAVYKCISNANEISKINNRLTALELKGAPESDDVVSL